MRGRISMSDRSIGKCHKVTQGTGVCTLSDTYFGVIMPVEDAYQRTSINDQEAPWFSRSRSLFCLAQALEMIRRSYPSLRKWSEGRSRCAKPRFPSEPRLRGRRPIGEHGLIRGHDVAHHHIGRDRVVAVGVGPRLRTHRRLRIPRARCERAGPHRTGATRERPIGLEPPCRGEPHARSPHLGPLPRGPSLDVCVCRPRLPLRARDASPSTQGGPSRVRPRARTRRVRSTAAGTHR